MYHIAICDDEPDFVAGIADQIRTLTAQSNIPCRISTYFEPAQLYDALCASQDEIHLVLLDILMLSLIHISEPTRQAEISYAVFCLKKKKKKKHIRSPVAETTTNKKRL